MTAIPRFEPLAVRLDAGRAGHCATCEAVAIVKRLCRQTAKPYVPLRSSGTGSFVSALARTAITPA